MTEKIPSPRHRATAPQASRYAQRGVSAGKEGVHAALAHADAGLFPSAFCKIVPDVLGGEPRWCAAVHADGAGSKAALAYLWYRETGDLRVFRGIAQDALVMNVDDLLCIGACGPFLVSNTIGRNAYHVPDAVIGELIAGYEEQVAQFARWGMELVLCGGETADLGDVVRTLVVDSTLTTRLPRAEVVANDRVRPGDIIIGLASDGQAHHESEYNSGIGSNGLTSARHDLLKKDYGLSYPETAAPHLPPELCYSGPYALQDPLEGSELSVGKALLSPTRSYAPVLKPLLENHREQISALVHCTGGGRWKQERAHQGIRYHYDAFPLPAPPLFEAIRAQSKASWAEMFRVFNMGFRMEVIGPPQLESIVLELAARQGIRACRIGHCEKSSTPPHNEIHLPAANGVV